MNLKKIAINQGKEKFRGLILPLVILIIWWIASDRKIISANIFPSPGKVIDTFIFLIRNGDLAFNIKLSMIRVMKGFTLGISAGFILGISMGLSKSIERLIAPLFHAIRQVPLLGWIPLIILWCGIGEISKVIFISIGAFYPIVINTFEGIRSVPKEYVEVAKVFEYDKLNLLRKVILPAALPSILTGIRFSLSVSWMLVVGAEIFTVTAGGIGDMMWEAREHFRMDIVFAGIIVIGIIGLIMNQFVELIETRLLRWRKPLLNNRGRK